MLVIGVLPKVWQLSYTNFGFVMILELLCWRHWEKVCNWKARGAFFMAYVGYNIFHPRWGDGIGRNWFFPLRETKMSPHKSL
jgi:hypothetical protein